MVRRRGSHTIYQVCSLQITDSKLGTTVPNCVWFARNEELHLAEFWVLTGFFFFFFFMFSAHQGKPRREAFCTRAKLLILLYTRLFLETENQTSFILKYPKWLRWNTLKQKVQPSNWLVFAEYWHCRDHSLRAPVIFAWRATNTDLEPEILEKWTNLIKWLIRFLT